MRTLLALVLLTGCALRQDHNPSGLTQEQAEAALAKSGFTDPSIGPTPDGWSGRAVREGYEVAIIVGKHGAVTVKP